MEALQAGLGLWDIDDGCHDRHAEFSTTICWSCVHDIRIDESNIHKRSRRATLHRTVKKKLSMLIC